MAMVASVASSAATAAASRIGAALSDAQYFESNMVRVEDIRRQLDSRSTKEKLEAMKRVIALISLGKDASTFFPDVVKNVAASSLEVKKLVYLYLVHYAEDEQDLALLAINSFQKDLSDPSQHIRALSLRVLSSIRVKVILQVVIHAIEKSAKDASAYVRKAAAHAICKVCALDSTSREALLEPLADLIADRSTQVIGSAIVAFEEVAPNSFELIHPHYRRICRSLQEIDPWGQIAVMQMLLRYARCNFADPRANASIAEIDPENDHDFYAESRLAKHLKTERNKDLALLLDNVRPLFSSLNNSVAMCAVTLYYHLASLDEFTSFAIKPLLRLVAIPDDGSQVVGLKLAAAVAARNPSSLMPYISEFFVSAGHSAPVRDLRMNVLNTLCQMAGDARGLGSRPQARRVLLLELKEYLFRTDNGLAAAAARAIGNLATAHPDSTSAVVKLLSSVVSTAQSPQVVTESIGVLRRLLQRHPEAQTKALPQLIALLLSSNDEQAQCSAITEPAARASIVWLIGEFYDRVQGVALEALRILAKGFPNEAAAVKVQILNLSAKLVAWDSSGLESGLQHGSSSDVASGSGRTRRLLLEYICTCARYDRNYDVRDKARVFHSLFLAEPASSLRSVASSALLSKKPVKSAGDDLMSADFVMEKSLPRDLIVGSMSHVLGSRRMPGGRRLEPWALQGSDSSLREEPEGQQQSGYEREYSGISSSSFAGSSAYVSQTSSSVWQSSNGVSSDSIQRDSAGRIIGFGQPPPIPDSSHLFARSTSRGIDLNKVDPDTFYDSPSNEDEEQSSSEYESSSEEDDEEESRVQPTLINTSKAVETDKHKMPSKEVGKPTSSYDIEALLGSIDASSSSASNPSIDGRDFASGRSSFATRIENRAWRRGAESWNGGGVEVDYCFSKSISPKGPDSTPTYLRLTNRLKTPVKGVKILSRSSGMLEIEMETFRVIQPGEQIEMRAFSRFRGKVSTLGFDVELEGTKSGSGELRPTAGEVLRPYPGLSKSEFLSAEKSLGGMFGSEARLSVQLSPLTSTVQLLTAIQSQILEVVFAACLGTDSRTREGLPNEDSVIFAGYLPSADPITNSLEKKSVLIRITLVRGPGGEKSSSIRVWIGCEDVLYAANLRQVILPALTKLS